MCQRFSFLFGSEFFSLKYQLSKEYSRQQYGCDCMARFANKHGTKIKGITAVSHGFQLNFFICIADVQREYLPVPRWYGKAFLRQSVRSTVGMLIEN